MNAQQTGTACPKTQKRFYDEGWNARVRGEPKDPDASLDWRIGWTDCDEARPEDRVEVE